MTDKIDLEGAKVIRTKRWDSENDDRINKDLIEVLVEKDNQRYRLTSFEDIAIEEVEE